MKNYVKRIGIIAFIAVIGFITAACVVYEEKHGDDFSLKYLPGTWKASDKNGRDEITATVVFSGVTNDTIKMTIKTLTVVLPSGGTKVGMTSGIKFIDELFGLGQRMEGVTPGGSYDSDIWERTYTQAEIKTLEWDLRTLGKEATLNIQYLIPAGDCNCENCKHNSSYMYCCNDQYCSSKPQGNLSAMIKTNGGGLLFKKQ